MFIKICVPEGKDLAHRELGYINIDKFKELYYREKFGKIV